MGRSRVDDPRVARTRERVVDAAAALLGDGGLDAFTHSAVAAASGVGRATLYRHWPDLDDLLVEVLRAHHPGRPPAELPDRLRPALLAHLANVARAAREDPIAEVLMTVVVRARRDERFRSVRDQVVGTAPRHLQPVLEAAVARGELRAGIDARDAGAQLVGPVLLRNLAFDEPPGEGFAEGVVDAFLAVNRPDAGR